MSSSNVYAKNYSNRRSTAESTPESYKLMLFPADNSIAVVKNKQCSPAEHDGFLYVQSGGKRFSGVMLEEGTLDHCSRAADRLTKKKVNPEIESDYERLPDENEPKQTQPVVVSTISTLKTVPFGNQLSDAQTIPKSSTASSKGLGSDVVKFDASFDSTNDGTMNISTNKSPLRPTSSVGLLSEHVTVDNSNKSAKNTNNQPKKRRKHSHKEKNMSFSFDDVELGQISSDDDDETAKHGREIPSSSSETPSFVGRRVIPNFDEPVPRSNASTMSSSILQQLTASIAKIESQYLRPILVGQERLETMAKSLYRNQQKMAKVLRKHKVNIQLTSIDEPNTAENDQDFLPNLMYESVDGVNIDLLKQHGLKENANLYVTALIDLLYKPQDLIALDLTTIKQDKRYLAVKEAVKNKFRLNSDEFATMWDWLHTVFLAKRRTLKGKYGAAPLNTV